VKVLKVLYEGGHEDLFLIDDLTASWPGWNFIDFTQKTPLYVTHQGGEARLNLRKVLHIQILRKKIVLTQTRVNYPDENPLNEDSRYEDPLS